MAIQTFLVTFKPLGRFYFGSSTSFAESFHARSLPVPTQTTILGCLRYTLLQQNGLIVGGRPDTDQKDKWEPLTGKAEMKDIGNSGDACPKTTPFGAIEKISPVFISRDNLSDFYLPTPADLIIAEKAVNIKDYKPEENSPCFISNSIINKASYRKPKPGKEKQVEEAYGGRVFWENYLNNTAVEAVEQSEFLVGAKQTGIGRIDKQRIVDPNEGKFYIKKDYSLKPEYVIGIILHLDTSRVDVNHAGNTGKILRGQNVKLGGENSWFQMKIQEAPAPCLQHRLLKRFCDPGDFGDFKAIQSGEKTGQFKAVCISALFGEGEIGFPHAVINSIFAFRSSVGGDRKSNAFKAIPQGSVFYNYDGSPIKTGGFTPNGYAARIGYNWIITI